MLREPPRTLTTSPITTGTSVVGIKYKDGVVLAGDTQVSYGSMSRYKGVERIANINKHTLLASSGEFSDFQEIVRLLRQQVVAEEIANFGQADRSSSEIAEYLTSMQYQRRNKMNPLYTLSLVAGYADGAPQLQAVDLYGTTWKGDFLLTGFAQYFCQVLCQNAWRPDFTEAEARALAEECMRVLFYRDSRATEVI